jgi:hypothetical protein
MPLSFEASHLVVATYMGAHSCGDLYGSPHRIGKPSVGPRRFCMCSYAALSGRSCDNLLRNNAAYERPCGECVSEFGQTRPPCPKPQPAGIPRDWPIPVRPASTAKSVVNQDFDSDPNEAQASDHFRGSSEERPNPSPCQGSDECHDESRGANSDGRDQDIDLHKMRG